MCWGGWWYCAWCSELAGVGWGLNPGVDGGVGWCNERLSRYGEGVFEADEGNGWEERNGDEGDERGAKEGEWLNGTNKHDQQHQKTAMRWTMLERTSSAQIVNRLLQYSFLFLPCFCCLL